MEILIKLLEVVLFSVVFIWLSYISNKIAEKVLRKFSRNRGFEKISNKQWTKDASETFAECYSKINEVAEDNNSFPLPKRATTNSAGYDVYSPFSFVLKPGEDIKIPTGFKAYMRHNEKLVFHVRSGHGFKYIRLANVTGICDSDYYNNKGNEGHCFVKLRNEGEKEFSAKVGDAIAQCIFEEFLIADDDKSSNKRVGGFGSTSK